MLQEDLCFTSLNSYFDTFDMDYSASYQTSNILSYIKSAFNNRMPCIGHINGDNGGHAVGICGYFIKTVKYYEDEKSSPSTDTYYFISITTGWFTSDDTVSSILPDGWYENNFSYIDVTNLAGITYIEED